MVIDFDSTTRRVDVDNRIPLRYYYRIADNLLKQASIYREEKNIVDLYIILIRYLSLVSETIPYHRDYQVSLPKGRAAHKKRSLAVLDEVESLKPEFKRRWEKLNDSRVKASFPEGNGFSKALESSVNSTLERPSVNKSSTLSMDFKQPAGLGSHPSWKYNNNMLTSNSMPIDKQFQKLSVGLPPPKKETLSRHSFLGPNGLQGQWLGPSTEIKVQYPSSNDLTHDKDSSLNRAGQYELVAVKDVDQGPVTSTLDSILSLDDGRWLRPAVESCSPVLTELREDPFQLLNIKQPLPPPVLAQVYPEHAPIPPSKVADPRPGPAKSSQDSGAGPTTYQHLHIPIKMMEDFLRLASGNTRKNLETCGVLAGSLKNRVFHITTLIIPKQESTSDSCQTLNEEEIFEVQDSLSLFSLGWIHTHPSQTCFMSSVDLHTHYSYQIMLPEAIAIVMAPTDTDSPHGIFHLSDPGGVSVIRNCQQRGFHPHEEPSDGSQIYEHCSHVYMNANLKFEVVDLRER
ncbi:PREDICTED: AMSH-like ubiquitin thioesterase 3 [Lupinus angustifolius]|uniref:AMSH-like ubiquitin thioesterase 3 n=1 Tax=Lupinus angustifolius TaxID=3871 RepID=UPI00092F97D9|nr:PREDICTED: AMSH-like ubiquitin thioesterase 3 [Lupinus angustifolius]XP_019455996.1 PREDICTED: AMSH-like ubiquitin thioesterase 3 [Lupinus angustifolius]XP_019456005.1 PREDICTED: AMSH-like ubiquitin thioesterase 3 [Lupinus angustifolius]